MAAIFFRGKGLLLTILVLVGFGFLCSLGVWQWSRHEQRMALNARIIARMAEPAIELAGGPVDPEALDYRQVRLRGVFDNERSVLLRNRSYEGITGYHLLTPLRLANGEALLVDRGWIPLTESSQAARRAFDQAGEVEIIGVARRSEAGLAGPVDPPLTAERPRLDAWFRVNLERIAEQTGYPLLPVFVEVQPGPVEGRNPPIPALTGDLGPGSHLSYAIQWFSFAIILVVGYVAMMVRGLIRR